MSQPHVSAEETLDTEFHRELGRFDSTMVVVGSMIGSGIFLVSAEMARQVGSRAGCWPHGPSPAC